MATPPSPSPDPLLEGAGANDIAPAPQLQPPRRRRWTGPRGVTGFVIRRVLLGLLTLFVVSIIVFAATQALPGDPAQAILGRNATPESLAALREQLGLNEPVLQQYLDWLGGILRGDLGDSLAAGLPIGDLLGDRIVNSAFLVLVSALISIPLSIAIGAYAALRRDGAVRQRVLADDAGARGNAGVRRRHRARRAVRDDDLRVAAGGDPDPAGHAPWDDLEGMILPTLTLVIAVTPYISRIMRASMIEVLQSDYVEMARLKGLPERAVVCPPRAAQRARARRCRSIALNLAYLAGGIIIVEYVFNFPGIGAALATRSPTATCRSCRSSPC